MQKPLRKKKRDIGGIVLTVLFSLVCILYVMPIVEVLINSFKTHSAINTDTFALPNAGTFAGTSNYVKGMTFGNYPFLKSLLYSIVITILSVTLILLCTSMAAWFISRVGGRFSRLFYLGCVFSMIVPFQMVMFLTFSIIFDAFDVIIFYRKVLSVPDWLISGEGIRFEVLLLRYGELCRLTDNRLLLLRLKLRLHLQRQMPCGAYRHHFFLQISR